jgi:hypothetical protein
MKDVVYEWERAETGEFDVIETHKTHKLERIWNRTRVGLEGHGPTETRISLTAWRRSSRNSPWWGAVDGIAQLRDAAK